MPRLSTGESTLGSQPEVLIRDEVERLEGGGERKSLYVWVVSNQEHEEPELGKEEADILSLASGKVPVHGS